MKIRIRPFEDRDHEASARAFTKAFPDFPISADHSRRVNESRRSRLSIVAEASATGLAVAFGDIWQDPYMAHPGKYWVWVLVEPQYHGGGIGSRLYDSLAGELSRLGAETVWCNARDDRPRDREFARRRGFRELWRNVTQRLAVDEADLSGLKEATRRIGKRGISITTLLEEAERNPDYLDGLHRLFNLVNADVPRAGYFTPVSLDDFASSPDARQSDAYFVAKSGGEYVGLSYLEEAAGGTSLDVGLTGVRREHRRQGVARALKLHTIKYAIERGFDLMETGSDSTNEAILALNESVGFRKSYARVTFEKQLGETSSGGEGDARTRTPRGE